ncbi:LUD domain-containing protein [Halovenus salina]|uniref:LUD domain-containing protein n=1 Tax=Halovenus salina TaxID=1510225 RepID=A0ABD5W520_9EURY
MASYGSLVLEPDHAGSEPVSLFNDLHITVVREADILHDMAAAFDRLGDDLRAERGSAIIATGPSATADMGALVQGAHGPKRVEVLVVT